MVPRLVGKGKGDGTRALVSRSLAPNRLSTVEDANSALQNSRKRVKKKNFK